jgi:hypothetical protein
MYQVIGPAQEVEDLINDPNFNINDYYGYVCYGGAGSVANTFFDGANASANTGTSGGGSGGTGRPGSGGSGFLVFRFNGILYTPKIQVSGGANFVNYTDGYGFYEFRESANITFIV